MKRELVQAIDLSVFSKYDISEVKEFFNPTIGQEHYRLLAYLSTLINNRDIFDIGTHKGSSALALSYNPNNQVYSFDIENKIPVSNFSIKNKENIHFNIENILDKASGRNRWEEKLLNSAIIFLDIDPHEGTLEYDFFCYLRDKEYKGILICDDIWYFKQMRDNFWYKIPSQFKTDVTELGHWSGTGLIHFPSCEFPFNLLGNSYHPKDTENWTLVTAYFDLTKMKDASREINNRPVEHYLSTANSTLSLDHNLVIFCEPENKEKILSMRPKHLLDKTLIITQSFEDFPLTQYRDKIIENRKNHPYHFDNRNTASYYLFCMSRYNMLKRIIEKNPFGSTHFAWINICIERMGFKNLIKLEEALACNRDKFSTCYIDYVSPKIVNNAEEYYRFGRCSFCSGFFTGNAKYMKLFCDAIENKFLYYLNLGYGHADEQLFSPVFFDQPEIFDWYVGDYAEMITNYKYPVENLYNPINHIITNSFNDNNYAICLKACEKVWHAVCKYQLPIDNLDRFLHIYQICKLSTNL